MKKYITIILILFFAIKISAQSRASVSASVTIVDIAGSSFTNTDVNRSRTTFLGDSVMQTTFTNDGMTMLNAGQTANLGKLIIMGAGAMYSVSMPGEPITLSRLSGTGVLTVQSLYLVTTKTDTISNTSMELIAACKPSNAEAFGNYFTTAPVDIIINYN